MNSPRMRYFSDETKLWNLLHDATVVCAQGSVPGDVTLVVECGYLRHMFGGAGEGFVVRLRGCTLLEFAPLDQSIQRGVTVIAEFEPQILSAESGDPLQVCCVGGLLRLRYDPAETALDTGRVISLGELSDAAKSYWRQWERGAEVLKHEASQLESPDEDQRRSAIIDASLAADPASLPALLSLLPRDTYANRRHIARALGRIGGPDAESALLELLQSEDGLLLGDVARALGQLKVVSAVEHLRALIEHDLDWVRSGAREALRRLGHSR